MHEQPYDLGLLLKKLRKDAKLTQEELGDKISRDKGIISRYESNYQTPPFETMREFAAIFNVSMDYLAGFDRVGTVQTFGLTDEQRDILKDLAEMFRKQNSAIPQSEDNKFKMLGRINACIFNTVTR